MGGSGPLVRLVVQVYSSGDMPDEMAWATIVLIPKSDGSSEGSSPGGWYPIVSKSLSRWRQLTTTYQQ